MSEPKVITEEMAEDIRQRWAKNPDLGRLSMRTGLPRTRIMAILCGSARIGDTTPTKAEAKKIIRLFDEGKNYANIARWTKRPVYRVKAVLRNAGRIQ